MYNDTFYDKQIQSNIKLLNSSKKTLRKQGEKNLLELKGRILFELRTANKQITNILNKPNYE